MSATCDVVQPVGCVIAGCARLMADVRGEVGMVMSYCLSSTSLTRAFIVCFCRTHFATDIKEKKRLAKKEGKLAKKRTTDGSE